MKDNHSKKNHAPKVHARPRSDDGNAFFPDPAGGPARVKDDLAEELAEEFLASATSGEETGEEAHERIVPEERGGPFVPSTAKREFAYDTDASNPPDAERAPFPITRSKRHSL